MRAVYLGAGLAVAALLAWQGSVLLLGPRVQTVGVAPRDLVRSVVATGRVEAPHRVDVGAQIVGTVLRVPVDEGQTVKAGQPLVELDDGELRAAAREADVAVAQARARLRQLQEVQRPVAVQGLRQAQATLDNARATQRRQEELFAQGYVGQAALDDARKSVELADAQLGAARKQLESAQPGGSDVAIAAAALAQAQANAEMAQARLRYATVSAPVDGVLISRDVERGDVVQPGKTLMVLSPAGETQLVVQFDEKNLGLLALGQKALASADAFADQRFAAELTYINPGVDVQRGSVEVKLRVPTPPAYLRQDMTVSVDVEVARRAHALAVPVDLLHDAETAKPWVLKVDAGHARRQPVRLGLRGTGLVEVLDGLKPGDQLVPASAGVSEGGRLRAAGGTP
ncbi:efflux RND transporter periplasmic adaptor subunit [Roseateles saccharophilus]|uniref:HlyD family secretion protein n=1 Tax=Roseateles saccharophilus TaxID=304 RepID=A0A4V6P2H8_ROSSA|nr:efflux RND transporter periplasmic adaptor subunit [Roseateles saccharophilus]MDG0834303.1 efflux RND transporter periplasmic adaptor subunit [Roseateles saccharophilus]TCU90669.1 HlyD family secretion protein [Roseateles saccharophilus]